MLPPHFFLLIPITIFCMGVALWIFAKKIGAFFGSYFSKREHDDQETALPRLFRVKSEDSYLIIRFFAFFPIFFGIFFAVILLVTTPLLTVTVTAKAFLESKYGESPQYHFATAGSYPNKTEETTITYRWQEKTGTLIATKTDTGEWQFQDIPSSQVLTKPDPRTGQASP